MLPPNIVCRRWKKKPLSQYCQTKTAWKLPHQGSVVCWLAASGNVRGMYSAHGTAFPKFYMTPEILKEDNFIPDTLALLPSVFITIGSIMVSKEAWNTAINSTASAEQQCLAWLLYAACPVQRRWHEDCCLHSASLFVPGLKLSPASPMSVRKHLSQSRRSQPHKGCTKETKKRLSSHELSW